MESQKVRVINEKGEARFVMPHIAKDKKLMKNYGYRIEDLNVKEVVNDQNQYIPDPNINHNGYVNSNPNETLDLLEVAQPTKKTRKARKPTIKK